MRILILNWRSLMDPLAGGAERATFENAKRWVKNHKAEVTWLSPRYSDKRNEIIDGIRFIYVGLPLTRNLFQLIYRFPLFYFLVFWTYMTKFRGRVDVVIDEVHGLPYLTPLYVKEKIVVYIHEVAGEIWDLMYPFPINKIGRFFEKLFFLPYKKIEFIGAPMVSRELPSVGISNNKIHTVNYGVSAPLLSKIPKKNTYLTVIYLNRLVKMKGPERAIDVFLLVYKMDKNAKLFIVGSGEESYVNQLKKKVEKLGLKNNVKFYGFVDGNRKFDLLSQAHVLINASYKEGWGLVNIEANRVGTPVVSFNVKGNSDSVVDGKSGFLFESNQNEEMAKKIINIKDDHNLFVKSMKYSSQFDWDLVSNIFYEKIK